jgi:hypothetical protein
MVMMSQTTVSGPQAEAGTAPSYAGAATGYAGAAIGYAGVAASMRSGELGYASTLVLLSQFKHLMAYDGAAVDTQRMLADSHYAFEQLALAHTSVSEPLRQCAMRVFAVFHA